MIVYRKLIRNIDGTTRRVGSGSRKNQMRSRSGNQNRLFTYLRIFIRWSLSNGKAKSVSGYSHRDKMKALLEMAE